MKKHIRFIFLASFFFSFHTALLTYVNSSMLSQFASGPVISIIYIVASILSLILVSLAPKIISRIGTLRYITFGLISSSALLYIIGTHNSLAIIPLFILYFSFNSVILYGLDLLLEHYSKQSQTGNIRGLYLTVSNIGWVLAPMVSGALKTTLGFSAIYLVAACAVAVTLIITFYSQRGFVDNLNNKNHFSDGFKILRKNKSLRTITFLNFLLQLFYVVMVIYSPIYLTSIIGFSWENIGIILSIMLLPFVLFPYPAGRIADKYLGEKELMIASLILMGIGTIYFIHIGQNTIAVYAFALFITRVGASILEAMCESAFFRQVSDKDEAVISIYRNMMPFAYSIGPLLAGALFMLTSYKTLFTSLGLVMIISTVFVWHIKDSK